MSASAFDPAVDCWGCGKNPAAYLWTPRPPGRVISARLCVGCCASWRAEAAVKPELTPSRIQLLVS